MNVSSRPYELTFEQRDDYLYARVKAKDIDRESAVSYLREIADECLREDCERLMIVRDIPTMLPDSDLFFTAKDFIAMIRGVRVAFVNPYPPINDGMKFAVMIGTNRGADYSVFSTTDDALGWLLE